MTRAAFSTQYAFGMVAEQLIAVWLRERCKYSIVPAYEKEITSGKGPRIFCPDEELVLPDMLAIRGNAIKWIEAKRKQVFTWFYKGQRWETGIDLEHYRQYQRVAEITPWPVWVLFLHESGKPSDKDIRCRCPERCPVGLFAQELSVLVKSESHQSDKWGRTGMVYWTVDSLSRLASLEEVYEANEQRKRRLDEELSKLPDDYMPGFE